MTRYKTYTRKEYLAFCAENCIKSPLPENIRNKFTECGYPTISDSCPLLVDEIDSDEWYKIHW